MNARDNIKPKSIRLAILIALADGEITTIDDLLLKVDEPRKKVVENAAAAANDGLLKRMRDDVTSQAAYQILPAGKKYLAKYADGSKAEPVQPQVSEDRKDSGVIAVPQTNKTEAVAVTSKEKYKTILSAEVLAQKDAEITSLSRRLRDAIEEIDRNNKMLDLHRKAELSWEKSMMETVGEDGVGDVVKAIESIKAARDNAFSELRSIRTVIGADSEESTLDEVRRVVSQLKSTSASLELSRMARTVVHAGYVIQRPLKPLTRITKIERAKERALSFARGGKKAQVFALVAIGTAVPGAEWKE